MADFYLEHPEELKQPKRDIEDYVESNEILVPQRFDSLKEAKKSGLKIIARSEHPQDYAGISDLLKSPRLSKDEWKEVTSEDLALAEIAIAHVSRSHTFKPEVSVMIDKHKFLEEGEYSRLSALTTTTGKNQTIPLYLISDGITAFERRL